MLIGWSEFVIIDLRFLSKSSMDTLLVEGYNESADLFKSNPQSTPILLENHQNYVDENYDLVQPYPLPSTDPNHKTDPAPFPSNFSDGDNSPQVSDFPDDCLNFISEILMEEDLDDKFGRFHDYSAILATEQSLADALREEVPLDSFDQFPSFPAQVMPDPDHSSSGYSLLNSSPMSPIDSNSLTSPLESNPHSSSSSSVDLTIQELPFDTPLLSVLDNDGEFDWFSEPIKYVPENLIDGSKVRKTHQRDETGYQDNGRKSKLLAAYDEDCVQMEQYDDVLLWKEGKEDCSNVHEKPKQNGNNSKASKGRKTKAKKQQTQKEEIVDLRTLLNLCAQAVSSFDFRNANQLLRQIKQHSSPYGDSIERVAHYFAYGLEARIVGTGSHLSLDPVVDNRISCSDILKVYRTYVQAIPLRRTGYYLANQTIGKMSKNATAIHIIDFGIFLGFQWPCFIQGLSKRENGPPKLRITGIGFPERGFKPAATVEETGKRLEGYCKRFNVPFEYNFIAKKWDAISLEDIKVERGELVVVNCMYESRSLFEETVEEDSPRDHFLKLIRSLNPDIFVHGIINGTFNAPFFNTRFREALFHYSAIFDMLEATIPKEDPERLLIERELYGKAALNVIACEGVERLERPETHKQWRVRTLRAGFREIELDWELVSMVKKKVKANYHKDFVIGEDGNWMLQGWKGRILYAISCWRPA